MGTYGDADLVVTAGVTYTRTFQYKNVTVPIDWSLYTIKSEVRDRLGTILLNLAPFMVVNPVDRTTLVLTIAAATTYLVPQDAMGMERKIFQGLMILPSKMTVKLLFAVILGSLFTVLNLMEV